MKTRLLKKLRRKAKKKYYIIKLPGNLYMTPEYYENTYRSLDEAINVCDNVRRDYIIRTLNELGIKRHKKIY